MTGHRLVVEPLRSIPEIEPDAELAELISVASCDSVAQIGSGDVLVVAQKLVSKAEDRIVELDVVVPSARAIELAAKLDKDARLVETILSESEQVLRAEHGVLIVRTHHGFVCANAGVDQSNLSQPGVVSLLPIDPDQSARRLRDSLAEQIGHRPAVVIADSFGRAWRIGQADVAIGCAGLAPTDDLRGRDDAHGRRLEAAEQAVADEAASAASLVRTKSGSEGVVIVRGLERFVTDDHGPGAAAIVRPAAEDLFN